MAHLLQTLPILAAPFVACLIIALLHAYAGLHVLQRGVIFVDLALAQMAALGAVVGMLVEPHHVEHQATPVLSTDHSSSSDELERAIAESGANVNTVVEDDEEHGSPWVDLCTVGFALGGAVLLAFGRFRNERVPHEAIIGIVYVVAAAGTVLILSQAPHGHERMEAMLVGKLLYVRWSEVLKTGALYAILGAAHWLLREPFLRISASPAAAEREGMNVRLWDCLFYAMFALMVTRSVAIGGVLVVFSFLIIPGACAATFAQGFRNRLLAAWGVSISVTLVGLALSGMANLPTGSTLVAIFGAALLICLAATAMLSRSAAPSPNAGP